MGAAGSGSAAPSSSSASPTAPASSGTQTSPGGSSVGTTGSNPGSASGSASGGSVGSASSGGTGATGAPTPQDAGCNLDISTYVPPPASAACWNCIAKGCPSALKTCASDCTCGANLATILACVSSGVAVSSCVTPNALMGGPLTVPFDPRLSIASAECPSCQGTPSAADASSSDGLMACVGGGGGGGAGNGACTATLSETCGGTTYQVVCASGSDLLMLRTEHPRCSVPGCPYRPGIPIGPGGDVWGLRRTARSSDLCGFPHSTLMTRPSVGLTSQSPLARKEPS